MPALPLLFALLHTPLILKMLPMRCGQARFLRISGSFTDDFAKGYYAGNRYFPPSACFYRR